MFSTPPTPVAFELSPGLPTARRVPSADSDSEVPKPSYEFVLEALKYTEPPRVSRTVYVRVAPDSVVTTMLTGVGP